MNNLVRVRVRVKYFSCQFSIKSFIHQISHVIHSQLTPKRRGKLSVEEYSLMYRLFTGEGP
jgi:hypothetical protein